METCRCEAQTGTHTEHACTLRNTVLSGLQTPTWDVWQYLHTRTRVHPQRLTTGSCCVLTDAGTHRRARTHTHTHAQMPTCLHAHTGTERTETSPESPGTQHRGGGLAHSLLLPLPESCRPAAGHPTARSPHPEAQFLPGQAASLGAGTAETLPLGQGGEPCALALSSQSGWDCTAAAPQYTPDQTRSLALSGGGEEAAAPEGAGPRRPEEGAAGEGSPGPTLGGDRHKDQR